MARQWFSRGRQVYEDGTEEYFVLGAQVGENAGAAADQTWFPIKIKADPAPPPPPPPPSYRFIAGALYPGYTGPEIFVWQPMAVKADPRPPEPPPPPSPRYIAGALFEQGGVVEAWFPRRVNEYDLLVPEVVPPMSWREPSPAILEAPRVFQPPILVQFDPGAAMVSRRHQQVVCQILNSLIRSEELVRPTSTTWAHGYVPSDHQDWAPGAPDTVAEALDRLAALLKTLNGGVGP